MSPSSRTLLEMMITVVCAVIASGGFWTYIMSRREKKNVRTKMLIGLAHDRIIALGSYYIKRGYIRTDEYDDLLKYLYEPYEKLGGNGGAKRVMDEVRGLPIKPANYRPPEGGDAGGHA